MPLKMLQKAFASMPEKKGIKFLIRLQDRVQTFVLSTIKLSEKADNNGIHPKHRVTDFHAFFLENISPEDKVLEVGCSLGDISHVLSSKAKMVTGLDIRQEAISKAQTRFKEKNLEFVKKDFFDYSEEKIFDVVVLSNILEHISDRIVFLKKAASLGKKLLIRVPAYDRDWMVAYKKELKLDWRLNRDHKLEYDKKTFLEELAEARLKVQSVDCKWGNYCCVAFS